MINRVLTRLQYFELFLRIDGVSLTILLSPFQPLECIVYALVIHISAAPHCDSYVVFMNATFLCGLEKQGAI